MKQDNTESSRFSTLPFDWHDGASQNAAYKKLSVVWLVMVMLGLSLLLMSVAYRQISAEFASLNEQRVGLLRIRAVLAGLAEITDIHQQSLSAVAVYVQTFGQPLAENDPSFLARQDQQIDLFEQKSAELKSIVYTAAGKARATQLQEMGEENLRGIRALITEIDAGLRGAALGIKLYERGLKMANMRQFINDWRGLELAALYGQDRLAAQQLAKARMLAYVTLAVSGLLVLMLGGLLVRHFTQRDRMEQQLRVATKLWSSTLATLTQGVGLYSADGRLRLWNTRFAQLHGVVPERMYLGMPHEELLRLSLPLKALIDFSALLQEFRGDLARLQRHKQTLRQEYERSDDVILEAVMQPMGDDYYVVTLSDISAMRRSEQLARDHAVRLTAIMNNAPDGIITINAQGYIESWNIGAQRVFGYAESEVLQRHATLLMTSAYAKKFDKYLQKYLVPGVVSPLGKRMELLAVHKDGREFPVDLCVGDVDVAGGPRFVGIVRDITEQRAVAKLKSEFIATVSHELRTPLTSIIGSLHLLMGGAAGELPQKSRRLLSIAEKNSQRLSYLINDILDVEKADAGRLNLQLRQHSLLALVEQAIEVTRNYGLERHIRFQLHARKEPCWVRVDDARITQVLANLLSNAVKFSPVDGTVLVELNCDDHQARVTVHDDGPGIPPAFRARIFERFAQADGSDARHIPGTGLGLAISKQLVELHRGTIGFTSGQSAIGKGQGASFWFELPLADV